MNDLTSSLLLLGIGGAGCAAVKRMQQAYGASLRAHLCDTDATTGNDTSIPFTLIGGNRLSGRGSGGDDAAAREAFRDDPTVLDAVFNGIKICMIVCSTGGGTACGTTREILIRLHERGVKSIVIATEPFRFEGETRLRTARRARPIFEAEADTTVFLPLDDLVADAPSDNLKAALARAADTTATAMTAFWRLLEKPGYIRLDAEHLREAISSAGRARIAVVTCSGTNRAHDAVVQIRSHRLMAQDDVGAVTSIILGILAGDDLRLSEISTITEGVRAAFSSEVPFRLGTVNDEETFSGRIVIVALVFSHSPTISANRKKPSSERTLLMTPSAFGTSDATIIDGENLDLPTFKRRGLSLDR